MRIDRNQYELFFKLKIYQKHVSSKNEIQRQMEKRFYNEMLGFILKIGIKFDVTLSLNESSVSRFGVRFFVNYE